MRKTAILFVWVLICGVLSPVTSGADPIILWNKLGSDSEVLNSEVGAGGTVSPPVGFAPVVHGSGVALEAGTAQVKFGGIFGTAFPDAGTVEFWWIPAHDENSSTGSHFDERYPFKISSDERHTSHWLPTLQIEVGYRSIGGASDLTIVRFEYHENATNTDYRVTRFYDLDFPAGQPMHVAVTWDKSWGVNPIRAFFDGVEGVPTLDQKTNPEQCIEKIQQRISDPAYTHDLELLRRSKRQDGAANEFDAGMYVDNFVIRGASKTDFSDRFQENPLSQLPVSSRWSLVVLGISLLAGLALLRLVSVTCRRTADPGSRRR